MGHSVPLPLRILLIVVMIIIFGAHTFLITHGYTSFWYERLRDVIIMFLALFFIIWHGRNYFAESAEKVIPLVFANLFTLIFTLHLLRLIFGGIKC